MVMAGKNNAEWRRLSDVELRALPPTRKESIHKDLKHYFTGKACNKGHLSARYSLSTSCVMCQHDREKARRKKKVAVLVRKNKEITPVKIMGITINKSLSSNTD